MKEQIETPQSIPVAKEYRPLSTPEQEINQVHDAKIVEVKEDILAAKSLAELEELKEAWGDELCKEAWAKLTEEEKDKIKAICGGNKPQEETSNTKQAVEPNKPTKTKKTLFDISEDIRLLESILDDTEDTEQEEIIKQFLTESKGELKVKLDNYAEFIFEREARAAALTERVKRMQELAQTEENLVKRLKQNLQWYLESNELKKLETDRHKLSIAKNGGKAPLIFDDTQPEQVDPKYRKVRYEYNRETIRKDLEAGKELSFAAVGEHGKHLRIR